MLVAKVERKAVPVTIDAVGTVQAVASISVKPRIDSQIVKVAVAEGAQVKEGDLLFLLDARTLQAQLAQADAQTQRDRAQIEQARRDLARAEDLLAKRISTEVQRDTAATAVKVQEAQLAADQAQRANLAAALSYTEIRAPVSGRIGSITAKVGTNVRSADAQPLTTVNQIDPIYVAFAISQTSLGDLRASMASGKVRVNVKVGPAEIAGNVAFIENAVDQATGTILVKALLPNGKELLWPGAFVTVQVLLDVQNDAIAVPAHAVQLGQQSSYVFTVENNKAHLKPVTVSRTHGSEAVIASGLAPGEEVVVDGQLRLVDGASVAIQPPAAARNATGPGSTGPVPPAPKTPRS